MRDNVKSMSIKDVGMQEITLGQFVALADFEWARCPCTQSISAKDSTLCRRNDYAVNFSMPY